MTGSVTERQGAGLLTRGWSKGYGGSIPPASVVLQYDALREVPRHARAAREVADGLKHLDLEGKAASTRVNYALTWFDLLEMFPGSAPGDFTHGDIEHLLAGYPRKSRPTRRAHLSSLFDYWRRTRVIAENPMDLVARIKKQRGRLPDVFDESEIARLCGLASPDGELMTLAIETGARAGEMRAMRRRDFNLRHAEVSIHGTDEDEPGAKGGKDRVVPLTMKAAQAIADLDLLERLNPTDYLWYSKPGGAKSRQRQRPIAYSTFRAWYTRCLVAAGVDYRKPHMTRHTFATRWRRGVELPSGALARLDLDDLQLILGHSSIQTTSDLYSHLRVQDVALRMAGAGI